ncbi:hypothetical protein JS533_002425 [Bifidobacterium amazonense]|uniref:CTP synthase n=1 Tax=Bifidobacterium amazonense TaxID=2809027 RepID=A0ABS9VT78_9BIFI|nr:hypothetical protein [Bifidobacterium amazonense]MCH9275134.1 hypothetical protein [Bifidobacterium amazonense]
MKRSIALNDRCKAAERQRLCIWAANDADRRMLRRRSEAGELVRVFGRCFARADQWNALDRVERYRRIVRSLAVMHPNWVFCDMTAAVMQGISDSTRHLDTVHIVTSRERHVHDYGQVRHHYVKDDAYELADGVRVTPLERSAFDCARRLPFPDGLAVIEAVLRLGLRGKPDLEESFASMLGYRRAAARKVLRYASGRTENGGEAYSLGVMIEERYMVPLLQEEIIDQCDLSRVYRVDFAWRTEDGRLIVGELDGQVKYRDPAMYRNGSLPDTVIAEKQREERIRLVADDMFRFSFGDALRRDPLLRKMDKARVPRGC